MINSFCFQSKEITVTGKNMKSCKSNRGQNHRNPEWIHKFKYK